MIFVFLQAKPKGRVWEAGNEEYFKGLNLFRNMVCLYKKCSLLEI